MRCTKPFDAKPVMLSRQVPEADEQFVPPPPTARVPNDMAVPDPPPLSKGCPLDPAVVGRLKLYVPADSVAIQEVVELFLIVTSPP